MYARVDERVCVCTCVRALLVKERRGILLRFRGVLGFLVLELGAL